MNRWNHTQANYILNDDGYNTTRASGDGSHAEGSASRAAGTASHAEGAGTYASANSAHAEGSGTTAGGLAAHAEGSSTSASAPFAHSEGVSTTASGQDSHAEGVSSTASGAAAHAEGNDTLAFGPASHAEGTNADAHGDSSHAGGFHTIAINDYQTAIGKFNAASNPALNGTEDDDALIIGNGTSDLARSNALRVLFSGDILSATGLLSTGADYAEMFEWQDGNPGREDRRGYFVTLEGEYIRIADAQDGFILGVVSAAPSVTGDAQGCGWQGMYLRDEWGAVIYEWADVEQQHTVIDAAGQPRAETKTVRQMRPKLNPAYNPDLRYQPRSQRPEWAAVGLLGKLIARDDGSCVPGGYCWPNAEGIAAAVPGTPGRVGFSGMVTQGYRVLKRLGEDKVLICLK